jgi:hypothetical protein
MEQRRAALRLANAKRGDRWHLRRRMASGDVDWRDVILDPPDCVTHLLLTELLMDCPGMQRAKVEALGRRAFFDGITLTVRAGRASTRTREWLVEHALTRAAARAS